MHHQIHSGQGEIAKSSEDDIELGRIAITPRVSAAPPSFAQSQLHTIIQRQVPRPKEGGGFKSSKDTSRFPNTPNSFEFAGWGSLEYIELTEDELRSSVDSLARSDGRVLGQWKASGVAGNDVLGSVFYALPAVVATASVYSPISLFIATLLIFFYRPIMVELASAIPISGANYTYSLNVSGKQLALVAATLTILDNAATAVVSAASASIYIVGEVPAFPFSANWLAILALVVFICISLTGIKESAGLAISILSFHVVSMTILFFASIVSWAKNGNSMLHANWVTGQLHDGASIARAIFNGVCLGLLGLTGIECAPDYVSSMKPGRYPHVLRNLHLPSIILNGPLMLFVLAILPLEDITSGANVLSNLAEVAGGRWLRILIVVDAAVVLCAGVLTGILGANALVSRLARDRVVPSLFLATLPSGAPWVSTIAFAALSCLLFATSGFSLVIVSDMFSIAFLLVMGMFSVSLLLLKFSRNRLPRSPQTSLLLVIFVLSLSAVVIGGNVALNPTSFGYFTAYFIGIFTALWLFSEPATLLRWACWVVDQVPILHTGTRARWGPAMGRRIEELRRKPVCCLVKTDEIDRLFKMLRYVSEHESTSHVKLLHFYSEVSGIPSELEANSTIIDEAFPSITVDLIFVQAPFTPASLEAISQKLKIDRAMFFMTCPSENLGYSLHDLGTRLITL